MLTQWFSRWVEPPLGGDFEEQEGDKTKGVVGEHKNSERNISVVIQLLSSAI